MHGACAIVFVPGHGPVQVTVFVMKREDADQAVTLAAFLYASEEAKSGRQRTA